MNIFKRAVGAVKQAARAVDVTAKKSAVRGGLREVDKAVGGGKGWGAGLQLAGAVVALVPAIGPVIGGGIIAAGKGVSVQAAKEDAARAAKKLAAQDAQLGYAPGTVAGGGQASPGAAGYVGGPPLTFGAWLKSLVS